MIGLKKKHHIFRDCGAPIPTPSHDMSWVAYWWKKHPTICVGKNAKKNGEETRGSYEGGGAEAFFQKYMGSMDSRDLNLHVRQKIFAWPQRF